MRCNEFDSYIDEMLSGVLYPDANEHMRQCERCLSHFRARASVQSGLRHLAASAPSGPSRSTDCAVMESFRRLHSGCSAQAVPDASSAQLLSFPVRSSAPFWNSRTWWGGAIAAAIVLAVFGSMIHLGTSTSPVGAPAASTAQLSKPSSQDASSSVTQRVISALTAASSLNRPAPEARRASLQPSQSQPSVVQSASPSPVLTASSASVRPAVAYSEPTGYDSAPVTQVSPNAAQVIRLASTGANSNVAQSASSTWPGYSNLMYCDPVVCSGPMQVVRIKVPADQVKRSAGHKVGNAFVDADVIVGPDGVARAIRVAK